MAGILALLLACGASLAAQKQKHPPPAPIDLNRATVQELQQLPGVGPAAAEAVVKFRERSGAFQRVEDLLAIHGISRAKFEKLRPYVRVDAPANPAEQKR